MVETEKKRKFKERGYLVLEDGVNQSIIKEARGKVWDGLPISRDSPLEDIYGREYGVLEVDDTGPFTKIRNTVFDYAAEIVGEDILNKPTGEVNMPNELQIVINYPKDIKFRNSHLRSMGHGPRGVETTAAGHLDGYGINFKDPNSEKTFNYSTIGAGVYLDTVEIGGGGLTVFPGSHWIAEKYFEDHSLDAPGWIGQVPAIDDNGGWDYSGSLYEQLRPEEITGPGGTVVLWHMKLLHCAAVNQRSQPRLATFSRFTHRNGNEIKRDAATNIWKYWEGMQDIETNLSEKPMK